MPRLRRVSPAQGGAPAELLDRQHPVWSSVGAVEAWAASQGLSFAVPTAGPASRFMAAATAWAHANGITREMGEDRQHVRPDADGLRARGIPFTQSSEAMRERLQAGGHSA